MKTKRIEFIEEYIRTEHNPDWQYNDNHGVLVRCKNCKHYNTSSCADGFGWCERSGHDHGCTDDWFCADGEVVS